MQIGGITTSYPFRTTATVAGTASAAASDTAPSLRESALDIVNGSAEADAEAIKARAQQRLEDAKKRLEFLRRWNFDPEILARQAGQLAREVGAAAKDFASAVTAGASAGPAAMAAADTTAAAQPAAEAATTAGSDEDGVSFAQKAYQDTMKDATEQNSVTAADRKTLEEFKAVAQEIKALLEEALRRMREQKNADQNAMAEAQKSGESLNQAIQGLSAALGGGSTAGALGMTAAIPASITI